MDSNLIDIMKYIIAQIDLDIPVSSVAANVITVCQTTKHVTVGKIVFAPNGDEYEVTALDWNNTITVTPHGDTVDPFPTDAEYVTANAIKFLHDDPMAANEDYLALGKETLDKTPFVWVLGPYDFEPQSRESALDASYSPTIFCMEWFSKRRWSTDDHNDLAVKPMQNLMDEIMQILQEDFIFRTPPTPSARTRTKFGVEVTDQGSDRKIINEDLSGLQFRPTIDVFDLSACKC